MRMIFESGKPAIFFQSRIGLVVVVIDGDEQPVFRQAEFLRDQAPGEFDRERLEIIAEREIAEHFKKRVMARGIADIVEVVVLAAGAHAFLRARGAHIGALFEAGEDVLELHHAGVGEHQGRVVARNERRRGHDLMAMLPEKIEKARANFVDAVHSSPSRLSVLPAAHQGLRSRHVALRPASAENDDLQVESRDGARAPPGRGVLRQTPQGANLDRPVLVEQNAFDEAKTQAPALSRGAAWRRSGSQALRARPRLTLRRRRRRRRESCRRSCRSSRGWRVRSCRRSPGSL